MDYRNYSVEDFVLNSRFRKWILDPQKEDNLFWEAWLKEHPEKVEAIKTASKIVSKLPNIDYKLLPEEKYTLWDSILKDVEHSHIDNKHKVFPINAESIISKANGTHKSRIHQYKKIAVAASILLVLSIGLYFFNGQYMSGLLTEEAPVKVVKETPLGQKSTIYLSDGTKVKLNSGSKLTFNKQFVDDQRVVILEGEAFFEVAKDVNRPFKVISKGLTTMALGTSFNVKALPEEQGVNVSLVTGKVAVAPVDNENREPLILVPGEQASYDEVSKLIKKVKFDPLEVVSWKDGVIYFKNADSKEVFSYLEKWYGVEIRVMNRSVKSWDYSGSFANMDLENVLTAIGYSMNFEFTINEEQVMVKYYKR